MAWSGPEAVAVTGAGRGIGREVALALAGRGIAVLCISRTPTAEDTAGAIRARGGSAESLLLDLADPPAVQRAIAAWIESRPHRRIAAVLAASELGPHGPLQDTDVADWMHTVAVNFLGNLAVVRALLPRMLDASEGRIVFFEGAGATHAYPDFPAYSASKTALLRAVENLHRDLSQRGDFAVMAVHPGAVETDMLQQALGGRQLPPGRTTPASESARLVDAFLHSDAAHRFSGRSVRVVEPWADALGGADDLPADRWMLRRTD
ncbi:MAG TPA: SDR family oxidoreductase [Candidatus Dormibacteraeota bacterium]|nr:SDR family oxidoreductase [Candidatus Dormibacteraeota bacterium]